MPGSIAAHTMAWQRRMGGSAGPLSASGEASNEQPVQVELWINGSWVDITAYVMVRDESGNISITRGRRDEGSTTEQATCQLTLNNRDGRWSPRNPNGVYFGLIGRNQPLRVSVPNGMGGKSYRFQGEVSIWPQSWDPTGSDVWTEIEASGILRRLAQGPVPTHSVLRTAIGALSTDTLQAYWPCEDPEGSTTIASALVNGSPMVFDGTPQLATFTQFGASDPLPTMTNASIAGGVAKYDMTTVTEYQLRYLLAIPKGGVPDTDCVSRLTFSEFDAMVYLDINFNDPPGGLGSFGGPGTLTILPKDVDEADLATGGTASLTMDTRGRLLLISLEVSNSGANLSMTLRARDVVSGLEDSCTATLVGVNVSRVLNIAISPETAAATAGSADTAVGHIMLQTDITPLSELGRALQPSGEKAGRRIERVCDQEGIAFESLGDLDDSIAMGGQDRLSPLDLMQECELADTGMLYESMPMLGLGYRTRNSLVNQDAQLTLNYSGFNLSEVPTPVEDDRYIQNQVTVTVRDISQTYAETDGALSTAVPPTGVGVYGTDVTLNLEDANEALSQAAWRVHLGTVDEPRYPEISVNLAHSTFVNNPALKQAVLGLRQGDRILVQNLPSWLPPGDIDQIILGFSETITRFEHRLTFVCAPASPYQAGVLDTTLAVIDTDGSELFSAAASGDTALYVVPSAGQSGLWTTDSADMPIDLRVGGEVVRASAISPVVYDTFTRTTANGWGTANTGQVWSLAGGAAGEHYTQGSEAAHQLTSINVNRYDVVTSVSADVDIRADFATDAVAAGGSQYTGIVARYVDVNNLYYARLTFTTTQAVQIVLQKRFGGVQTDLATVTATELTHAAFSFFTLRFQITGSTLKAKAWPRGTAEPPTWHATATDTDLNTAGSVGARSILDGLNTNVLPVVVSIDNFQMTNVQTFTVTRSINGIVKAHAAGEDVRLAYPTFISL